jgi:para-nitrobenzyl esterase
MSPISRRQFTQSIAAAAIATAARGAASDKEPVIATTNGRIRGRTESGVNVFKGIHYGAPTGGVARFQAASTPKPWSGVRDAYEYGAAAPQVHSALFNDARMDEDCLVLNVWSRAAMDSTKRPVMVWLHGGGFSTLSGSSPMYDGTNLALRGDVVVVTLNHRLNVFGFLHLADIDKRYADSGNVGMLDIILALQWVKANIKAFGGDPANVTIFGESGGGRKVSTLLAMPAAKGLFHRAIIQSGPGIHLQPRDKAQEMTFALLDELRIGPANLDKLQDLPAQDLLAAFTAVESMLDPDGRMKGRFEQRGFVPTVGTPHLPNYAFDPLAPEISAGIPLLIGTNRHELALWSRADSKLYDRTLTEAELRGRVTVMTGTAADRVLSTYARVYPDTDPAVRWILMLTDRTYRFDSITLAQRKAANGRAPTYMYYFTFESPVDPKLLAHHALEIPFVFDNTLRVPIWTGTGADAAALAATMSEAWITFARTGDPATKALGAWPAYDSERRATMIFDRTPAIALDPDGEIRRLWTTV